MSRIGKDVKQVVDDAIGRGWLVERVTSKGHIKLSHPDVRGGVIVASKDGDPRGIRNAEAMLRRAERDANKEQVVVTEEQDEAPVGETTAAEMHECVLCGATFDTSRRLRGHIGGKHSSSVERRRASMASKKQDHHVDDADEIIGELVDGMVFAMRAAIEAAVASERSRADRLAEELAQVKTNLAAIAEMLRDV